MKIECTFWEDIKKDNLYLRRFVMHGTSNCNDCGTHNAMVFYREEESARDEEGYKTFKTIQPSHDDPRWPKKCDHCEYIFTEEDNWQVFSESIYQKKGSTERIEQRNLPAGAIWSCWWVPWKGPDGLSLSCKLPNGIIWHIDGPATNCNMKNKKHNCWDRTGTPPLLTVGKGTNSCSAGAGSILAKEYHAFLRNGFLEDC